MKPAIVSVFCFFPFLRFLGNYIKKRTNGCYDSGCVGKITSNYGDDYSDAAGDGKEKKVIAFMMLKVMVVCDNKENNGELGGREAGKQGPNEDAQVENGS